MKRNKVERKRLCLLSKYIITLIENNYMEMHKSSQQKKINEVKKKEAIFVKQTIVELYRPEQ